MTQSAKPVQMKDFVRYVVQNLVDIPSEVHVTEVEATNSLIIELKVAQQDIGKIIGKRGKTINSIRTLVMSVASRMGLRVSLEIIEDRDGVNRKSKQVFADAEKLEKDTEALEEALEELDDEDEEEEDED